jgi:hypothetical protein
LELAASFGDFSEAVAALVEDLNLEEKRDIRDRAENKRQALAQRLMIAG